MGSEELSGSVVVSVVVSVVDPVVVSVMDSVAEEVVSSESLFPLLQDVRRHADERKSARVFVMRRYVFIYIHPSPNYSKIIVTNIQDGSVTI